MGLVDALNHGLGFFLPALAVGGIAAALAKLAWRKALRHIRWSRLATWSVAGCAVASLVGLIVFGRDGVMTTYGAMVLASAFALLWAGFGPGRR